REMLGFRNTAKVSDISGEIDAWQRCCRIKTTTQTVGAQRRVRVIIGIGLCKAVILIADIRPDSQDIAGVEKIAELEPNGVGIATGVTW
ncbi:hypothetical protein, partial [Acidithiobacillus thiooxidans]|uniref:hypothetical protein n=1 Tax=Acidithiobacillus thiooxidans TaxID=930 RepID=UPI0005548E96